MVQWLRASNILYPRGAVVKGVRTYYIYRGAVVKDVEHIISTVVQWLRTSNIYIYRGAVVKGVELLYLRGAVVKGVEHIYRG